jgi:hypothetical protein
MVSERMYKNEPVKENNSSFFPPPPASSSSFSSSSSCYSFSSSSSAKLSDAIGGAQFNFNLLHKKIKRLKNKFFMTNFTCHYHQ